MYMIGKIEIYNFYCKVIIEFITIEQKWYWVTCTLQIKWRRRMYLGKRINIMNESRIQMLISMQIDFDDATLHMSRNVIANW